MSVRLPADPFCEGCGSSRGNLREVRVENPSGRVTVCEDCEGDLRGEIVEEVTAHV